MSEIDIPEGHQRVNVMGELRRFPLFPSDLWTTLWSGAYPRIHDVGVPADRWLAIYVATYVERDVRQVLNVVDLVSFTTFVRLVAGRSAQEGNLSALGSDAGIAQPTARAWLSVLEASFLLTRLPAWIGAHESSSSKLRNGT
jgi:predicted AAA+ superfamily ATPase